MVVFTSGNLAYLPITKNASSTFTDHFIKMGWQENQLDLLDDTYEIFGHLRHPIERHFKGTAQFLIKHNLVHLADDPDWQKVWATSVMDLHSYPITWATQGRKIHWIPIQDGVDVVGPTRMWLKGKGIDIGEVEWRNESDNRLKLLYKKLRNLELENKEHTLVYFYDADLILWDKVSRGLKY